ncbi:MAG: hypothetical protein H0X51_05230 [Parachlamydiaceae bacterium]|nr:hypothetical protein [Parachlamydiaceae bacterium]
MEMKKIKKYQLDFNKVFPYFKEHVECGHTLSKTVLKNIDLTKGDFYIVLPNNALLEELYLLKEGRIIPQEAPFIPYEKNGQKFLSQKVTSTDEEIKIFVKEYLDANDANLAILEDVLSRSYDNSINFDSFKTIFIDEEVYYLIDHLTSLDFVGKALIASFQVWHTIYVLTQGIRAEEINALDPQTLQSICKNTTHIIITAFDGDTYIIWEKAGQAWNYPGFELTELPSNINFLEPNQSE